MKGAWFMGSENGNGNGSMRGNTELVIRIVFAAMGLVATAALVWVGSTVVALAPLPTAVDGLKQQLTLNNDSMRQYVDVRIEAMRESHSLRDRLIDSLQEQTTVVADRVRLLESKQ